MNQILSVSEKSSEANIQLIRIEKSTWDNSISNTAKKGGYVGNIEYLLGAINKDLGSKWEGWAVGTV